MRSSARCTEMSPVEAAVEKPDARSDAAASVRGGGSGGGGRIAPDPGTRIRSSLALSAFRVFAVRRRDRDSGKQVQLWADLDYSATAFVTNDHASAPEQIAAEYDARAEIEPRIAELKNGLGIGKVPTQDFNANHLMLQVKLLAHNLVRRYVSEHVPQLRTWRSPWLTRALFCVPGRLSRSGRQIALHVHPASRIFGLQRQLC